MKKITILTIMIVLLASIVSATDFEINFTTINTYRSSGSFSNIQLTSLKYEPYPVNPGEYFTLWIKAENVGNELTEDAIFELVPEYPFSLDSNEDPIREYGQLTTEPVVMEYKVRVDKDAVDGTNELKLRYKTDKSDSNWIYKEFDIIVDDAQTDFDLVVQEVSDSEVSIAIANTGKNIAYSVIVRIPEQEGFQTTGTNGQMVGNLEDGDYTLVGFDITEKRGDRYEQLKIDYTDEIGERRKIIKEILYSTGTSGALLNGMELPEGMTREEFIAQRTGIQSQTEIYQEWWFWAIIVAVLYAGWKGFKFYKRKKEEKEEKKHKK